MGFHSKSVEVNLGRKPSSLSLGTSTSTEEETIPMSSVISDDEEIESSTPPSSKLRNNKNRVKFGNVIIRSYDRTVGDNPACTSGVPIGLSWVYNPQHEEFPVEKYEERRDGYRREMSQMRMPPNIRQDMLRYEFDISIKQIRSSISQLKEAREQRNKTIKEVQRSERMSTLFNGICIR